MSQETIFDLRDPWCQEPTGHIGTREMRCAHGIFIRDASVCGATKPCPRHGGEFPLQEDIPRQVKEELLKVASAKGISYYYLCAIYRKWSYSRDDCQ